MTNWTTYDQVGDFVDARFADDLRQISEKLGTAAEAVGDVARVLEIVEAFLGTDPIRAAMAAVGAAYTGLINGLEGTDIYVLPLLPHTWKDLLHPYTIENALVDVESALADRMDPSRPLLGEGDAYVACTILVGADNWMDFRKLLKILDTLFSDRQLGKWARLADFRFQFDKYRRHPLPRAERGSQGETWDWYRSNWMDLVPPLGALLRRLRDLADALMGGLDGLAGGLRELADTVRERADYLRQVADELEAILRFLAGLRDLIPKASVLVTRADRGGVPRYVQDLRGAGNQPRFKLVAGLTIFAGTANPGAYLDILSHALGIQLQDVHQAVGRAEQV